MVDLEIIEKPRTVLISRILGWLGGSPAPASTSPLESAAEEFDFYAAEEALLDN